MPTLRKLNEKEALIFLHLFTSKQRESDNEKTNRTNLLIDSACSDGLKEKLARISEEENFSLKNAYLHQANTMHYAKKEKMPIDARKVRDALRQKHLYRA